MSVRTLGAVLMCELLLAIPLGVAADPEPDLLVCLAEDDACASDDAVLIPEGTQAEVQPDRLAADADERPSEVASPTSTMRTRFDDAPVPTPTPTMAGRSGDAPVPRALLPTRTSEVPLPTPPVPTRSIRPPAVIQSSSTGPATQAPGSQDAGPPPAQHLPPGPATRLP